MTRWSIAGFLKSTKPFHDVYAPFTTPTIAPIVTFLVEYGHLLIGLLLLVGLTVRVSACQCGLRHLVDADLLDGAHELPLQREQDQLPRRAVPVTTGTLAVSASKRTR